MAKKNPTQAQAAVAASDTGTLVTTDAATATPATTTGRKPRKQVNPDETIYWNGARDAEIVRQIMANPGRLTAAALAEKLGQSPAFAGDEHLLAKDGASEKIRQHVKKLGALSMERFGIPLELKRGSNSGYSAEDTLGSVFAELGLGGTAQVAGAAPPAPATASTIPSGVIPIVNQDQVQAVQPVPQAQPQAQPQFIGGLIPTP